MQRALSLALLLFAVAAKADPIKLIPPPFNGGTVTGVTTFTSSVTASAFFGYGGNLTGISAGEANTYTSSKTFTAAVLARSTFSIGPSTWTVSPTFSINESSADYTSVITNGWTTVYSTNIPVMGITGNSITITNLNKNYIHKIYYSLSNSGASTRGGFRFDKDPGTTSYTYEGHMVDTAGTVTGFGSTGASSIISTSEGNLSTDSTFGEITIWRDYTGTGAPVMMLNGTHSRKATAHILSVFSGRYAMTGDADTNAFSFVTTGGTSVKWFGYVFVQALIPPGGTR